MLGKKCQCVGVIFMLVAHLGLPGCGSPERPVQQVVNEKAYSDTAVTDSESGISIETANRFHLALIARVLFQALDNSPLEIRYDGILATDTGRRSGERVHGSVGVPLQWEVVEADGTPIFGIMITANRTSDDDITCRLNGRDVYVHVSFIQGVADIESANIKRNEIDKKRELLKGKSIQELLQHLEGPEDEIEKD